MSSFSEENDVTSPLRQLPSSVPFSLAGLWTAPQRRREIPGPLPGLRAAIEGEVIPRLVLSHLAPVCGAPPLLLPQEALRERITELADLAEATDMDGARALADALLGQGMPLEQFFLQVLVGAAQVVGYRWERDQSDFIGITMATGCLQSLLRQLGEDHRHDREFAASERRILLVPLPGEDHSFGAALAAELFRRRGWHVDNEAAPDLESLARRVSEDWFHVVALSISCDIHLPRLIDTVRRVRAVSRNRRPGIMVGGCLFNRHPEWLTRVGADVSSSDALSALSQAEQLVGLLVQCR